ncbi:histidine phosphatase family protein [Pelagibius litoralis]|uniref:Histidine phosphatase family protein n=1 Tax=Pelagibius litoralis TaxID=374515 RepID=A0A967C345_9PROT|nr:histidine phosphatase family protein [Pelagibius litoralis]NIA68843.1 histidine phosphatase family protein [Pelagibius litoralis]
MPHLLLLRHAKSSWDAPALNDFDRPLADRGRRAAPVMGSFIGAKPWRPALVLCSSAVRARETLDLVLPKLPVEPSLRYLKSLYLAPPSRMIALLRQQAPEVASIMVVAHNPGMENLALRLAKDATTPAARRMAEKFPTAALAHFKLPSWRSLGEEEAALKDFIRPRDLG